MKSLNSIKKRLEDLGPESVDTSGLEQDIALFKKFVPCYLDHLQKLGIPEDIQEEMKEALATTGPRPFGHNRPDDRPCWMPMNEVASNHWNKWGWRIKAAQFYALADLADSPDEAEEYRKNANEHLEYEVT